jgi:CubicO group peptidase (beta-lactamase class C family)
MFKSKASTKNSSLTLICCGWLQAVWLQSLLLEGRHPESNQSIIPSWIIQDVVRPQLPSSPFPDWPEMSSPMYGFGQWVYTYRGHSIIGHYGAHVGQKFFFFRLPGEKIGVAVMANDEQLGYEFCAAAVWRIFDELLGMEAVDFKTR